MNFDATDTSVTTKPLNVLIAGNASVARMRDFCLGATYTLAALRAAYLGESMSIAVKMTGSRHPA